MTRVYSGLELIHYAFKDQIKSNSDLIALFVHWYLVKNGFECIIDGKVWFLNSVTSQNFTQTSTKANLTFF